MAGEVKFCCRFREDWSTLSPSRKSSYISAVKTVSSDPIFQPLYESLVQRYRDSFDTLAQSTARDKSQFFPWHRYYLLEYEDLLRMIDTSITIPFWDWSLLPTLPYQSSVFNPETGFGNTADEATRCVTSGPFQEGEFEVTPSAGGGCLMRLYNSFQYPSRSLIENQLLSIGAGNFTDFHNSIQLFINLNVRCFVGGHMCTPDAANDPLYMLQLARMDRIIDSWQNLDNARANAQYSLGDESLVLTFAIDNSLVITNFSSNKDLPHNVCVQYDSLREVPEVDMVTAIPHSRPDLPTVDVQETSSLELE